MLLLLLSLRLRLSVFFRALKEFLILTKLRINFQLFLLSLLNQRFQLIYLVDLDCDISLKGCYLKASLFEMACKLVYFGSKGVYLLTILLNLEVFFLDNLVKV
jgi:hypothetical protein